MSRATRRRFILLVCALSPLVIALVAALALVGHSVTRARHDLLRRETNTAVELVREVQSGQILDSIFPGRWTLTDERDVTLDQAVTYESPVGVAARAALYDADSWYRVGTVYLSAPTDRHSSLPLRIVIVAAIAVVLLNGLFVWWVHRPGGPLTVRLGLSGVVLVLTGTPVWLAAGWSRAKLTDLTNERMQVAARALELAPDLDALVARPGGVMQLTGLQFMVPDPTGAASFSTLSPAATLELDSIQSPFFGRAVADRVEYAVADVVPVRLAVLPYEHTEDPIATIMMIASLALLVTALPLSFATLASQPRTFHRNAVAWSFLAPSIVHLTIFTVGPLAFAAWLSLHRWSLLDAARPFVGLANYVRLLGDGAFWNAIKNTAVFTLHVPFAMALALAIALVIHRRIRGIVFLRAMLFLPTITSLVAIAMVWQWMLHDEYGLINWLLSLVGFGPVDWLTSPSTALVSIMIMSVWMIVGYQMILFQAGLAAIPREYYDAARIDGAGPWRSFLHVTLPGLRHTLFFVLITSVIGSFQVFGAVYVMTEGGPLHATDVAVFHIYEEAWRHFRFGDAAAMSWVLFAIIFMVTLLQFRTLERRAGETA
ncbi:MAG: sugar ABC transporter permease [Gemmatimonadota bacterium]|nr:MAG: sugar ABC transporter permease [Gemmatimonadota bacterium]